MEQIKQLVFANYGIIYGGFVRDEILNHTPNDMDVYFKNNKMANNFINNLQIIYPFITIINSNKYSGFFSLVKYTKITITKTFSIDVIYPYEYTEKQCKLLEPPFNNLDFTCNGFLLDINGIRYSKNTGTILDKLPNNKRNYQIEKIKKDMYLGNTDLTKKFYKKINDRYVLNRINKMINRKNSWHITNYSFLNK